MQELENVILVSNYSKDGDLCEKEKKRDVVLSCSLLCVKV